MRKLITSAAAGLALAGTAIGAAAPADAQRWHGGRGGYGRGYGGFGGYGRGYGYGWHRGGSGAAVAAGILGLGVGAALASNRGYYGGGYYGYAPVYGYGYAPPPPPYAYGGYCRSDWQWDGYRGRYVRVRFCD
jgi:hypothetical protein